MILQELVAAYRHEKKLGTRAMASLLKLKRATYNRFERGEDCGGKTLTAILLWALSEEKTK